jgi:dinuclear metal center YbgI/SA1388 family protein
MVSLEQLVAHLNDELKTEKITDYPGAMNGLQLANSGKVTRVVAAVDASLSVIEAASAGGPGLLIVHHGMFWQGVQAVTGAFYKKLKTALDSDLAIYSSHLPLDIHPVYGNNALLAKGIGLVNPTPFLDHKGLSIGLRGEWKGTRLEFADILSQVLGGSPHLCPGGPEMISKVGIITGGAGSEVAKVAASGIDCFVTGEGPHWSYPLAQELGVNLFYGGHYTTETFGVKAICASIAELFAIPCDFVDRPTGL